MAVKVQRPGVAAGVSLDLTLLGRWARFVEAVKGAVAPAQRPYDVSLVEAFSAGAWGELDYEREAENQRFMRAAVLDGPAAIRRGVVVPEVRAATRRALVTDWVEGDQLARAAPATIQKLVPLGVELFMFQLLDLGFYHCDFRGADVLTRVSAAPRRVRTPQLICTEYHVAAAACRCDSSSEEPRTGCSETRGPGGRRGESAESMAKPRPVSTDYARRGRGVAATGLFGISASRPARLATVSGAGDPHPGNLLVDGQGRLALIDFGLCTTIGAQPRDALTKTIVQPPSGHEARWSSLCYGLQEDVTSMPPPQK